MGAGKGQNKRVLSSIGNNTAQEQVSWLTRNTVDSLPEGALEKKILTAEKENKTLRFKLGIDPTAPDIHLGHMVVLQKLREAQDLGHQVVLIIGDFTATIGDPSGRSKERPVLSKEEVKNNANKFTEQAFKILNPDKTEVRFNSEWLNISSQELLVITQEATVAQLIERKDFRKRLDEGKPLSINELLYPIMQGYDSVAINADVEIGGTDQKFNLLMGRSMQDGADPQSILTMPLLRGLDGTDKMSKSKNNYIGLNDHPNDMYGKTMSIPDELISEYYSLVLGEDQPSIDHPFKLKQDLAFKITEKFHDKEKAIQGANHFKKVHQKKQLPDEIPVVKPKIKENGKVDIPELISKNAGVSKSEARRMLRDGAIKLNQEKINDLELNEADLNDSILQVGKRKFFKFS